MRTTKRKKEEREKRKMEKMKALGTEYMIAERKRKLKKKLRKRKRALKDADEEDEDYEEKKARRKVLQEKKIQKIKKKKAAWENVNKEFCKFSSGSDGEGLEDEEELEELYHEIEDRELLFKSDHEFSCESEEDDDWVEIKHARTGAAKKRRKKEESDEEVEEFACKKCGHGDHPEWILLCDSCDVGWHASCLRPALMVIPEGAWFCPDCNHKTLLSALTDKLSELDSLLKKTEAERRRKERLAFINKSLSKTLPTTQKKESNKKYESSSDDSSSETDSEDDILLPRKCRTKNPVNYNTEEFDQIMNKALSSDLKYQRKQVPPAISEESDDDEEEESGEEED